MREDRKYSQVITETGKIEVSCQELNQLKKMRFQADKLCASVGDLALKMTAGFTSSRLDGNNPPQELVDLVSNCLDAVSEYKNVK